MSAVANKNGVFKFDYAEPPPIFYKDTETISYYYNKIEKMLQIKQLLLPCNQIYSDCNICYMLGKGISLHLLTSKNCKIGKL